jgi:two-component system, NtrC family, response regulator AtoC
VQAKLLRVLELRRSTRLGSSQERPVDVRLVAATNCDLATEVKEGRFRSDLFFRLATARIVLPPLRERPLEIPLLARLFTDEFCRRPGRELCTISPQTMRALCEYHWPGNVRELKSAMEYGVATALDDRIEPWNLPPEVTAGPAPVAAPEPAVPSLRFRPVAEELDELERRRIGEALTAADGVHTRAAALINMPLRTFQQRLRDYGLARRRT